MSSIASNLSCTQVLQHEKRYDEAETCLKLATESLGRAVKTLEGAKESSTGDKLLVYASTPSNRGFFAPKQRDPYNAHRFKYFDSKYFWPSIRNVCV